MSRTSIAVAVVVAAGLIAGTTWRMIERAASGPDTSPANAGPAALDPAVANRSDAAPQSALANGGAGVLTVTLFPLEGAPAPAMPTIAVTRATAQVQLRLHGELPPVDELSGEVMARGIAGGVRRLPIDAASPGGDGARAAVTLPGYALEPGEYTLTVWRGDAEPVRRYVFRVTG